MCQQYFYHSLPSQLNLPCCGPDIFGSGILIDKPVPSISRNTVCLSLSQSLQNNATLFVEIFYSSCHQTYFTFDTAILMVRSLHSPVGPIHFPYVLKLLVPYYRGIYLHISFYGRFTAFLCTIARLSQTCWNT